MSVDISGLDKDRVLRALWEHSKPAAFFAVQGFPSPSFNLNEAKSQLRANGYADYICGRVIKANIYESDIVSSQMYDRDNGVDAMQGVINKLRR